MNRNEALDKVKELISGQRDADYGSPEQSFTRIADYWSNYLWKQITAGDFAVMMILLKESRLSHSQGHIDSLLDIAGYAANGVEIVSK